MFKVNVIGLILSTVILLYGCRSDAGSPVPVSMISLIANPDDYEGQIIQISGVLSLEFENQALYLSSEAKDTLSTENAIWLEFSKDIELLSEPGSMDTPQNKAFFHNRFVMIKGVFVRNNKGHMSAYGGTLTNVSRIVSR